MKKEKPPPNPFGLKSGQPYRIRFTAKDGQEDTVDGYFVKFYPDEGNLVVLGFDGYYAVPVDKVVSHEERNR